MEIITQTNLRRVKFLFLFTITQFVAITANNQKIGSNNLDKLLLVAEQTHSEAVIVCQNNRLITENYFGIGKPEKLIETMSFTKSIVGLAVACILTDGLIENLDVPVCNYYPEWRQGQKKDITIRHLVNMVSGLQNNPNASIEIYPSPDFVKLALAAELSNKPGSVFSYNNKSMNLIAGVIQKITGKRMDIYIAERLFKPLKIKDYKWTLDSAGNPHVMSGCQMRALDFAKIGLLLVNEGEFGGQQIISKKWIQEVKTQCSQYPGYGMLWWIDHQNTISTIDNEIIEKMRSSNIAEDFVKKITLLKGVYNTDAKFNEAITKTFGPDGWNLINASIPPGVKLRKKDFTGTVSYRADGYLGNYIIVNPETKIVAVWMISHDSFKNDSDNFSNFKNLVLELCNP